MYITVKSLKRNLGFKDIELTDICIGFPLIIIVMILLTLTKYKMFALIFLLIVLFLLLPINISKKNRMYKILILLFRFLVRDKSYIYSKSNLERRNFIEKIKCKFQL